MKNLLLTLCFFCITSSAALTLPARMYDVQVVIFSHITPTTLQLQQWPVVSPNVSAQSTPPSGIAYNLQREKNILQKNPQYQILMNANWKESWVGDQSTVTIPINIDKNNQSLNGVMTITLGHYFDVHTNLSLTEPTALLQKMAINNYFSQWNKPNFTFQLLQNRRMRSNELNYIEHPLMGMLIKIIPMKR